MNPVMYLIADQGLRMSSGKLSAQVAHAAVEAARISDHKMLNSWYLGNHHTKIVLMAEEGTSISNIQEYIEARGFKTHMVIDEGRTEVAPFSKTVLGVEIVDKSDPHVQATFGEFKLYKDLPEVWGPQEISIAYDLVGAHGHLNRKGEKARKENYELLNRK